MAGLGTTVALIKALGSPDPAVIEQSVSDWLDDHPEATTTVEDGSITKAKLDSNLQGTVDNVSDLKNAITQCAVSYVDTSLFEQGTISAATGEGTTNSTRIRTKTVLPSEIYGISLADGYSALIYAYNGSEYIGNWNGTTFIKSTTGNVWFSGDIILSAISDVYSYRIAVKKDNGNNIAPSEATNVSLITPTDKTLSLSGKPADAKTVFEVINENSADSVAEEKSKSILDGQEWEIGSISTSGSNGSSTVRIRTKGYIKANFSRVMFTITSGYRFAAVWYSGKSTSSFLRDDYWMTEDVCLFPPLGAKYLRLVVGKVTEETASLNYAEEITASGVYEVNATIDILKSASNYTRYRLQTDPALVGKYINAGNGNTGDSSGGNLDATGFIPVGLFDKIIYKRIKSTSSSPASGIAFYDAEKHYVSGVAALASQSEIGYADGLYEAKVPDTAEYVRLSVYADTQTYGEHEAYGSAHIVSELEALQSNFSLAVDSNELNFKNLAGMEANVYYPVDIPAGTSVVMSTADGAKINQSGLELYFYDENKSSLGYYSFTSSSASRAVKAPGSSKTKYLKWGAVPNREVQVEIGSVKTAYVPYYFPVGKRIAQLEQEISAYLAGSIFNGEPYSGEYDWQTPVVAYGALFKGKENVEAFGFFTDPHVMGFTGRNEPSMKEYIKKVSKVFRSVSCPYFVCGGDWLNNDTVMDEACYRLGYIKALAKNMLCDCKMVIGNHDTNYQGKADSSSERGTGRLTDATIAALMFNDTETRKAYYSFNGIRSKCYVLDTGIEHSSMLSYDWEQVAWLAGELEEDDPEHAIIFLHIIKNSGEIQTNTSNFGSIVEAYNEHTTVTLNGATYDFSGCSGHVDLWVGGHTHVDSDGTLGGIPYIITGSNGYTSDIPLIDLFLVDYDNAVVKTIRVGETGEDRTIQL